MFFEKIQIFHFTMSGSRGGKLSDVLPFASASGQVAKSQSLSRIGGTSQDAFSFSSTAQSPMYF
jgi:hypothetical protein